MKNFWLAAALVVAACQSLPKEKADHHQARFRKDTYMRERVGPGHMVSASTGPGLYFTSDDQTF